MLRRRNIRFWEIFSVLLFAILANFLFEIRIDFRCAIDWIRVLKTGSLAVAALSWYLAVDTLRSVEAESIRNFEQELTLQGKASTSIDLFYKDNLRHQRRHIVKWFIVAAVALLLFFFFEPLLILVGS